MKEGTNPFLKRRRDRFRDNNERLISIYGEEQKGSLSVTRRANDSRYDSDNFQKKKRYRSTNNRSRPIVHETAEVIANRKVQFTLDGRV